MTEPTSAQELFRGRFGTGISGFRKQYRTQARVQVSGTCLRSVKGITGARHACGAESRFSHRWSTSATPTLRYANPCSYTFINVYAYSDLP
jgi:hypothetical protein